MNMVLTRSYLHACIPMLSAGALLHISSQIEMVRKVNRRKVGGCFYPEPPETRAVHSLGMGSHPSGN